VTPALTAVAGSLPWWALPAAAAAVLLTYLGLPLLVWLLQKPYTTADVIPREPLATGPADRHFDEMGPPLADLGFADTQRWTVRGTAPNVLVEMCTMAHRERPIFAVIMAHFAEQPPLVRLQWMSLEFNTRFPGGALLSTTNVALPLPYDRTDTMRVFQFPHAADPGRLLRLHEALLRREFPTRQAEPPPARALVPQKVLESIDDARSWQVRQRWFRARPDGCTWDMTLRGAFTFAWPALWPMSRLIRRRVRRRAKALERELLGSPAA
jgi:hypothetical protein